MLLLIFIKYILTFNVYYDNIVFITLLKGKYRMKINISKLEKDNLKLSNDQMIRKYETKIFNLYDPYLAFWFAENVKGANIREHEKIILNFANPEYSYMFVKNIKGANINDHSKIIVESEDLGYNYMFARDIPGADIDAHAKVILESKNLEYNYLFAKDIPGADIAAHAKVILENKDLEYNYLFLKDIPGSDIAAHSNIILESKDLEYNYKLAKNIPNIDLKKIAKIIIESKNLEYNYIFARDIPNSDIKAHAEVILESKDIKYNYLLLKHIKQIDVIKHMELIENDPDSRYKMWKENVKKMYPKQETLAIIKPDGMKNIEKIIEMIYQSGLIIKRYEIRNLDDTILKEHYSHLINKPFYPKLENYMMSGPVSIMVLEGYNAVDVFRNLMGPTDSTKAKIGTIRGNFGTDITYNAVHGSDSKESAQIEIERFFDSKIKVKK